MNPIKNEQQLSIILPSHNRAFAEAIKNASAQQLSALHENITPQNLLSELFGEAIKEEKSKQILLELVKNSPLLKELGSIHTSLSKIAELLKEESAFQSTVKLIESINKDDAPPHPKTLHQKIADSGVFLESKLSRFIQPGLELSSTLQELSLLLQKSGEEKAGLLSETIEKISQKLDAETHISKENPKILQNVRDALAQLDKLLSQTDPIHGKKTILAFEEFKALKEEWIKSPSSATAQTLSNSAMELYKILMGSKEKESVELLKVLDPVIFQTKNSLSKATNYDSRLQESIHQLRNDPKWNSLIHLLKNDPEVSQTVKNSPAFHPKMVSELQNMLLSKSLPPFETLSAVKNTLQSLIPFIKPIPLIDEIKHGIEQILSRFDSTTIFPKELDAFITKYESLLHKSDLLYSKETLHLYQKLTHLSDIQNLPSDTSFKENIQNDLKGELLKVLEEAKSSPELSKRSELTASVEKALTIIDYHQLLSHLSNSTSVYIPMQWDMLEEGTIKFKKREKEKFYCEIDLKLVEYGRLNLLMAIFGGNQLEIQIHPEQEELQKIIQENLPILRSYLISAGLHPRQMRVYEQKNIKQNGYLEESEYHSGGFEEKA